MKYSYPAIFNLEPSTESTYNVIFPDVSGCSTFGTDLPDAIEMAEDALCLGLYWLEQEKKEIPKATPATEIELSCDDFVQIISVDTEFYERFYSEKKRC